MLESEGERRRERGRGYHQQRGGKKSLEPCAVEKQSDFVGASLLEESNTIIEKLEVKSALFPLLFVLLLSVEHEKKTEEKRGKLTGEDEDETAREIDDLDTFKVAVPSQCPTSESI